MAISALTKQTESKNRKQSQKEPNQSFGQVDSSNVASNVLDLQHAAGNRAISRSLQSNIQKLAGASSPFMTGTCKENTPIEDCFDLLQTGFKYILFQQLEGVRALKEDLEAESIPTITEQLISSAVTLAITAATGFIGGAIAEIATNRALKFFTRKDNPELAAGVAESISKKDNPILAAGIAESVSESVEEAIGGIVSSQKVNKRDVADAYIYRTSLALIQAQYVAERAFIHSKNMLRNSPNVFEHIQILDEAICSQMPTFSDIQWQQSLIQWTRLLQLRRANRSRQEGQLQIELTMPKPTDPIKITKVRWPGLNERTLSNINAKFGDRTILEANIGLKITVFYGEETGLFGVGGRDSFVIDKDATQENARYPTSGSGYYWLLKRAGVPDYVDIRGNRSASLSSVHAIWADVALMKFKNLPLIET